MDFQEDDEAIPYRAPVFHAPREEKTVTDDEQDYDTLRSIHRVLKEGLENIDKWHAFDSTESELKMKQQVVAHRMAYGLIAPLFESVDAAIKVVDDKYREQ